MFNWEPIFTEASRPNISLIYFGIGSAMTPDAYSQGIEDCKNQQYPPFLKKYRGRKLIVLFDTNLEEHLAIEKYLEKYNYKYEKNSVDGITVLQNDEIIVYAIRESFEFYTNYYGTPDEIKESATKASWYISNLINLISICLEKKPKTKIIVQDFTGRDITYSYINLFNIFDKTDLLNNVMFDVTQIDGGCYITMNEQQASIDSNENFIQEKYMELKNIKNSPLFKTILSNRIQYLIYPISSNYVNLRRDRLLNSEEVKECEAASLDYNLKHWKNLLIMKIYNLEFNELNTDREYLIHIYEQLIIRVLEDIIKSKNTDSSAVKDIFSVIDNRNVFINSMMLFNYD